MPLPLILGLGAAIVGAAGLAKSVSGFHKIKDANAVLERADALVKQANDCIEQANEAAASEMSRLGQLELQITESFETFADLIEHIHNRPIFENSSNGAELPHFALQEMKSASLNAKGILASASIVGIAGSYAAAGGVGSAVLALSGTSAGSAIGTGGAARTTNAAITTISSGALAVGGGSAALGTAILGGASLGVGLLVGGIVLSIKGERANHKAEDIMKEAIDIAHKAEDICQLCVTLSHLSRQYYTNLSDLKDYYDEQISRLKNIFKSKSDWNQFNEIEKLVTENTCKIVTILHKICNTPLIIKSEDETEPDRINIDGFERMLGQSRCIMSELQ